MTTDLLKKYSDFAQTVEKEFSQEEFSDHNP